LLGLVVERFGNISGSNDGEVLKIGGEEIFVNIIK